MSRNMINGLSRAYTVAVSLILSLSLFAERTTKEELEQSGPLVDLTVPEGTIHGCGSHATYPVRRLFDNQVESADARWLGIYAANNMWAVYTFDTAKCVNAFMLKNAGTGGYNQTGRAPKTFRLRGSNDFNGSNYATATWIDLDSEASETGWTSGEKRYYSFKSATAYASYALHVDALNGGTDYVQLDEMEMYCISTDYVTVAGDPAAFGSPDPGYGDCFEVETGVAKTFRAPAAYTNAADTLRATCAGWIHQSSGGATLDSGNGNETSITYGAAAVGSVLTWRWNAQCLLSFSASLGGTVTGTPGWKAYGASVTLTPVPSQGYTFLGWEGDVDAEDVQTSPLELTMDRPRNVRALFVPPAIQGAVLVSPFGDDATGDGSAWNKSYHTVGAALAAVSAGATIQLAPGRYELTSELTLDKSVTIVGSGKGETVLTRAPSVDNMRILNMTAAATVRDLTITGGNLTKAPSKTDAGAGAGVQMTDGTLDNCEICGCTNGIASANLYGGAIAASGTACLTGCVIRANYAVDLHGGALSLAGSARATHCLISDNVTHKVRVFSTGSGASVRVSSSTAALVNCTVTRNFSARSAAVNVSAGVARDCLIWGNDGLETNDKGFDAGKYAAARFPDCYIGGANPDFVDALRDDFRLMAGSPVADGVGAFAKLSYGEDAACELRADSPIVLAEADVTFTATAFNCTPATYTWDFGDGTPSETTTEPTVIHAYAAYGVYTVTLTVDGETFCVRTNYLTVRPKKMYVNAASANPAYPYATAATAARDVDTVGWLLLKGMALEIAAGDYRMESTLRIPENMTVVGSGWTNCVLRQNGTSRAVTLYGGAWLENVMVTGGVTPNWGSAGGILTFGSDWTIAGCCITNNASTGNNDNGGGLTVGTGTITHCIICKNWASGSGPGTSGTGGGLYVSGTLKMDNCLIYGNSTTDNGGGVYLASTSYLTNCTVVGNTVYKGTGGGIYLASGAMSSRLVNCIFSDNVADKDAGGGKPNWGIESDSQANREKTYGKVKNCLFNNELVLGEPVVDGSVSGAPQFQSVAENDYHLKANSPARDAGLALEEDSVDLDGNVRDATPDMGCFEYVVPTVFSCSATVNPMAAFVDEEIELMASVTNQPSGSMPHFVWTLTDTNDKSYEIEGEHVKASFPHPGKFTVRLDATAGGQSAFDALENRLQIAVRTNYVTSALTDAASFPYDTPGTAATNVLEILPWTIDGSTIVADAGDHLLKDVVTLDKAVSVVGAGMNATTFRRAETKTGRCFVLNHSVALVSDLTIADGYCGEQFSGGGNVYVDSLGGTVRRCRLTRGFVTGSNNGCGGAAVYMGSASALLENCEIVANTNEHSNADIYTQGAIVKASYGTMRNCLVANNRCTVLASVAVGAAATLDNCTVVDNETLGTQESAVALSSGGGNVRNCIFSGNRSPNNANEDSAALGKPNWCVSAENLPSALQKIKNCCWDGSTPAGTDALAGSLLAFRDAANGNWRLAATCALYGKGLNDETWMRTATDLDGKPRILGRKVDPGCYEMDAHGLMLIVR